MEIYVKHNDVTNVRFSHLKNFETQGYLPYVGILGGDETHVYICMDCGKIRDWEPISDEEVEALEGYEEHLEKLDAKKVKNAEVKAALPEPVINATVLEKNHIIAVLKDAFGSEWEKNPDAIQMLRDELSTATGTTLKAIKMILGEE
jgi:hypothetical protein